LDTEAQAEPATKEFAVSRRYRGAQSCEQEPYSRVGGWPFSTCDPPSFKPESRCQPRLQPLLIPTPPTPADHLPRTEKLRSASLCLDDEGTQELCVESRTGAVAVVSRWHVAELSLRRLSPVWHGSVSCSRSSNRTGAFRASGSRRKFTRSPTESCSSAWSAGRGQTYHAWRLPDIA
jgi:hypothetical protein